MLFSALQEPVLVARLVPKGERALLQQAQASRLRTKTFICDTDFILAAVVTEVPESAGWRAALQHLVDVGCRLVIPRSCLVECVEHAAISWKTYNYFGPRLLGLNPGQVKATVNNAFVAGYYFAITEGHIPPGTEYGQYLRNYYELTAADQFFRDVIAINLPEGIQILDIDALLTDPLDETRVKVLTEALIQGLGQRTKARYRDEEATRDLASNDAWLFLACTQLNEQAEADTTILGSSVYLVTESSRYSRAARRTGFLDSVSMRPSGLAAVFDLLTVSVVSDLQLVTMFADPLLAQCVEQCWEETEALLNEGISLRGVSLARLRRDLDSGLHELLLLPDDNTPTGPVGEEAGAEHTSRVWQSFTSNRLRKKGKAYRRGGWSVK